MEHNYSAVLHVVDIVGLVGYKRVKMHQTIWFTDDCRRKVMDQDSPQRGDKTVSIQYSTAIIQELWCDERLLDK